MKLSKTGWNNIIIFSVMLLILMINATNDKLFPDGESDNENKAEQLILPEHAVILALEIHYIDHKKVLIERIGRRWQLTTQGMILDKTDRLKGLLTYEQWCSIICF